MALIKDLSSRKSSVIGGKFAEKRWKIPRKSEAAAMPSSTVQDALYERRIDEKLIARPRDVPSICHPRLRSPIVTIGKMRDVNHEDTGCNFGYR